MIDEEEAIEAVKDFNAIDDIEDYEIGIIGDLCKYSCDEHGDIVIAALHDPRAESNKFCPECYEHLSRERITE